jgi:hypothetical protein
MSDDRVLKVRYGEGFREPLVKTGQGRVSLALSLRGRAEQYVCCTFKGEATWDFGMVLEHIAFLYFANRREPSQPFRIPDGASQA